MPEPNRPRFDAQQPLAPQAHGLGDPSSQSAAAREAAVRQFVARVGGVENAREALELWALLSAVGQQRPKAA